MCAGRTGSAICNVDKRRALDGAVELHLALLAPEEAEFESTGDGVRGRAAWYLRKSSKGFEEEQHRI